MATNGGRIEFQVGLNADAKSLDSLKQALLNIQKIKPADFSGKNEELKEIKETATQVEIALKKAFNTKINSLNVGQFNNNLQTYAGGIDHIYSQFSKLGPQGQVAFAEISKSALTANFQLKQTSGLIQQMGTTLVNTIKWNIASSAINNFTQGVQSAFTYVKSLDAALTDIRIVTGDSQQKMQQFAVSANKAAQSLGRSTMDYTKSALTFYQQGLSDEDVQARTEAVLKAQNITGTGSEMADYMTAVWNGYKVANEEAELYVDKLAAVADSSASDMSQLAIAMSRVASTASNMGVDIDQLNAQIATVVATTRQAPESVGTAFKTIYTRLNDIKTGADEAEISLGNYSGKMASIGFNVLDTNGRLRDTGQIMEEIGERWQTLTKEQQIYLASTMGGQRQVNQLMALFNNWTTYSDLLNVSLESEGTLAEKNSRYMESLGAKMNQLAAAQQHVKTAMIDTDSWKAVLQVLTTITDLFGTFVDSIGGGGNALIALGSILMQVFNGAISNELTKIITNLNTIRQNERKKHEDIQMTQLFGASKGYEESATKAMVDAKREIQQYYSFISAEQANTYNEIVKQLGATQQQLTLEQAKVKKAEEFTEAVAKAADKPSKDLADEFLNIVDSVEKAENAIKELDEERKQRSNSSIATDEDIKIFKNIYSNLSQQVGEGTIKPLQKLKELIDNNSNSFAAMGRAARQAFDQIKGRLDDAENLSILKENVEQAKAAFELASASKDQFLQNIRIEAFSRAIVGIASATGQVASGFNSLKNVFNIWSDENISAGQKFLKTIMNLSFAIPSLVNGFSKLKTSLAGYIVQQQTAGAIADLNQAKRRAEYFSLMATKTARENSTHAQFFETAAKKADVLLTQQQIITDKALAAAKESAALASMHLSMALGVVTAALTIGTLVWQKHQESIKKAEQASKNFTEKQKQLANNTQSVNNQIQELKELKEEYDKLSEKAGKYDSNISSLTESEKNRWDQIKNKLVSINPEILSAYNAQGEAILNNNDALDKTIEKLKQKNKLELESYVSSEEFKDARKGRQKRAKDAEDELTAVQNQKSNLANMELSSSYGGKLATDELSKILSNNSDGLASLNEISKILDYSLQEVYDKDANQVQKNLKENFNKIETQLNKEIEELEKRVQKKNPETLFDDKLALQAAKSQQRYLQTFKENNEALLAERFNFVRNLDGQEKAAQSKFDVANEADVTAIKLELTNSTAFNANYQALVDEGVENADAYITAYLQGNKQGFAQNEAKLRDAALGFENDLLIFQGNNSDFEAKLKEINQEYKTKTFNSVKERIEWLQQALQEARNNLNMQGITNSNDLLSAIFKTYFNIEDISFDDQSINIKDKATEYIEKIFAELKRINPNTDFTIDSLEGFLGDGSNLDYILKKLGEIEDGTGNQHCRLQQIKEDGKEILQLSSSIAALNSITQTGEKLQSGKSASAKDQAEYRKSIQQIIDAEQLKPEQEQDKTLIDAGKILLDSYLAGSQAYEKALKYFTDSQVQLMTQQAKLTQQPLTDQQFEAIAQTFKTAEEVQEAYDSGKIKDYTHYQALLDKTIREQTKTLKRTPQALKLYATNLQKTKTAANAAAEQINLSAESAKIMALNDFKLIDALESLQKQYKNLKDDFTLEKAETDPISFFNAFSELASTINKIPGIQIDLTNENATEYFQNIKDIAEGVDGAVEKLRQKLASQEIEKIKIQAGIDKDSEAAKILNDLNSMIQDLSPDAIRTHAYLVDTEFVNQLNKLITECGLTTNKCNAILSKIGVKAKVKWENLKFDLPKTGNVLTDAKNLTKAWGDAGRAAFTGDFSTFATQYPSSITYEPINSTGGDGDVISPGGSGGKGGGGGGSQGKALSKKDQKKEDLDPYHDINRQLERINKQYSLLEKNEEKLVGTDLIDNLTDQNKLLDKNIGLLRQKHDIGEEERKQKAAKITPLGVEFDERGEITNYNEIRQKLLDEYNALIKEWNELAEAGTALPEEERKKKEEDLKEAQKKYEEDKKNIDDYLEHLDTQAEVQLQLKEKEEQKIQNEIKKFKIKIDLHIDYSEALRDWRDFEDKVIDQLRDDDIFGNIESRFKNIFTYFDEDDIGKSLVGDLTDQVNGTLDQIEKMKNGVSQIYGNNMAQALQDLDKYTKQLMSSLTNVKDLMEEIKKSFFDLVNKAQESFDEQTDEYEALASWIEHDRRLMELLYGDEAYEKFLKFDQKQAEVNLKQLDFYQKQKDFWWEQMEVQKARMVQLDKQSNAYKEAEERFKELEKHWLDTAKTLNSTIEQSIENLITKYEDSIDAIFGDLDKKLTNGKGLQPLAEEWQLIKDIQDDYLDDVDKIYEVDKLENAVKDAIKDNENNPKAQQALNKFMQDRVDILKEQDKLTQYDIDHANKALEIELKRIALQDSRNSKTRLRLKRDASGNYSYQFVADEEEGENKLQELKDLQHQLYTLDKNRLQELQDEYLSSLGDFFAKVQEMKKSNATDEQIENFTGLSYQKFDNLSDMILKVRDNLPEDMWGSIENLDGYLGMTEEQFKNLAQTEQQEFLGKTVPGWKNGVSDMIDTITAEGGLEAACQDAFKRLDQVTEDYQKDLKALEDAAKINFEEISKGINDTATKTETLLETNEGLIKTYEEEFGTMQGVIGQLQSIAGAYGQIKEAAEEAAKAALEAKKAIAIDPQAYSNKDEDEEKVSNKPNYKTFIQEPIKADSSPDQVQSTNSNSSVVGPGANLSSNNSTVYTPKKKTRRYHTNTGFKGAFATGGYTGSWGDEGKLAILHEKELVLNKDDTANILAAVSLMRHINSALNPALSNLNVPSLSSASSNATSVDQQVHIQASFPNVQDRNEIEQAFNNLINRASQYAFNTDR